jgi:hypothetical protein
LQIDLSALIVEFDQGTALAAVCKKYNNRQLFCLRHFLVSLKRNKEPALPSDLNFVLTVTPPHVVPEIERKERE